MKTTKEIRHDTLQSLCRNYLGKLRSAARKHNLENVVVGLINANKQKQCSATEREVEMLARMCNDDRLARTDIPEIFGKSYRYCVENNIFDRIKTLSHVGIYSKVSAILCNKTTGMKRK